MKDELSLREQIGIKVREKRDAAGMTQIELADFLQMSRTTILNIEQGRHATTIRTLYMLGCLFKCPIDDFFPPKRDFEIHEEQVEVRIIKQRKFTLK